MLPAAVHVARMLRALPASRRSLAVHVVDPAPHRSARALLCDLRASYPSRRQGHTARPTRRLMTEYGRLFARFTEKMMEVAIEECCREQRPLYLLDTGETWASSGRAIECEWCRSPALYEHRPYDTDHCDPPIPWMARSRTCDARECVMAEAWFFARETDSRLRHQRRRRFRQVYGGDIWQQPKEALLLKALAMILDGESRRQHGEDGKNDSRVEGVAV